MPFSSEFVREAGLARPRPRSRGVGVVSAEDAINGSLVGPVLRASGVPWDLRKAEPYLRESENYQNALNLTAMAYNMLGEHALAMDKARAAVALDTLQGYPYTTVAETFAFTGEVDSFYHYMEVAFQKGFKASNINASEPPYKTLAQEPRYRALVERYGLKD